MVWHLMEDCHRFLNTPLAPHLHAEQSRVGFCARESRRMRKRPPVLAHERFRERAADFEGLAPEPLFTKIWQSNLWGAETSRSGLGSEDEATAHLRAELPLLLQRLGVKTLLDLPCGDFGWMCHTNLDLDRYIGGDIVTEIVTRNTAEFATADGRVSFQKLNLLSDPLPLVDAVLCRDCLVHLSYANIGKAFANLRASGSTWLIATTFPDHDQNLDAVDGDWRLLNLEKPPFNLPAPVAILNEKCDEAGGGYDDKSLGAWKISDLPVFGL